MLEGDKELYAAQETSYRICRMANKDIANNKLGEKSI